MEEKKVEEENKAIEISPDTRLKTNPDFILREIGGECILVPVGEVGPFENTMLTLNETSAFLWKMFMECCTPQEALDAALQEYESEEDGNADIYEGIYAYIMQSLKLGLLQVEENS